MKYVTPIYGKDFGPGYVGFSRRRKTGHIINDVIVWFGNLQEACDFSASHVFVVVNERMGIESAERGAEYFNLQKRLSNPDLEFVFREPSQLGWLTVREMLEEGARLEKKEVPYDYTGLIFGHPIAALGLARWFKPLRKMPVLFHWPGSMVCSSLGARLLKATTVFKNFRLFREWNILRITPVILYNHGPFKPFRFDKNR
jgi:hypothetical protein